MVAISNGCTVVSGVQWGNEGKGRLVYHLSQTADVCARFNGGANNVHTLTVDDKGVIFVGRCRGNSADAVEPSSSVPQHTLVLRLFPLGVLNKKCKIVFGNGMLIHLGTLVDEIRQIQKFVDPHVLDRTYISNRAHIVFDVHIEADNLFEELRENKLGTTQKGIGPAYSTKTIRNGVRMGDFLTTDLESIHEKVTEVHTYFSKYFKDNMNPSSVSQIVDSQIQLFSEIQHRVVDTVSLMNEFITVDNMSIICESANSFMSDVDFGTYPFVTSSNTTPGAACLGLGIPPTRISKSIGVCKAYTSRAQHWFPSIMEEGEVAKQIRANGLEFGTTNQVARRIGWLDLVQVKYACDVSGYDSLMVTKLEALADLPFVGIVVGYANFDVENDGYPATQDEFERIVTNNPVELVPAGWTLQQLEAAACISELPENAKSFLNRIEQYVEIPVEFVQVAQRILRN